MDPIRQLIVTLGNLGPRARDAAALAAIPETQQKLDAAKSAALSAALDDAKAKAAQALAGRGKSTKRK